MSKDCLPEDLKSARHWDYPPGLKWIPRSWTTFCLGKKPPKMLAGNQLSYRICHAYDPPSSGPSPIGEENSWQLSWPPYFAFSTGRSKDGKFTHYRIGFRWDDVWGAYSLSVARRKYTGDLIEDTSVE